MHVEYKCSIVQWIYHSRGNLYINAATLPVNVHDSLWGSVEHDCMFVPVVSIVRTVCGTRVHTYIYAGNNLSSTYVQSNSVRKYTLG